MSRTHVPSPALSCAGPLLLLGWVACATEATAPPPIAIGEAPAAVPNVRPPPPALALEASELVRGMPFALHLTGADPQDLASFVSGAPAPGAGACPPVMAGSCLDLVDPVLRFQGPPDPDGSLFRVFTIPPGPAGAAWGAQAVDADVSPAAVSNLVQGTVLAVSPADPIGYDMPFGEDGNHGADYLWGNAHTVDRPFVITGLGYDRRRAGWGLGVTLAVYSDANGMADRLVVSATTSEVVEGPSVLPTPPTAIPPGVYWVMLIAEEQNTFVGSDDNAPDPLVWITHSFDAPLPDPFEEFRPGNVYLSRAYNYWMVGY